MEDLCSSMWLYQEGIEEMREKLQYALFELEAVKMKADEQARKHREEVNHLLNLLKLAQQERDEAKSQLTQLPKNPNFAILPTVSISNPNSSSITESDSLSRPSSPLESFLDTVSSPEFSSFLNQQPLIHESGADPMAQNDFSDALIDDLVKGKPLPQKGKFLTAVMEAGPLLQTLLVAGRLPEWRNPPPAGRFWIPPIPIRPFGVNAPRGCNLEMCSASGLNFGFGSVSVTDNQILAGKRQRLV